MKNKTHTINSAAKPVNGAIEMGWLSNAQRCASPNFNQRPRNASINLLVIHNISLPPAQFGGGHIEHFFCNELDAEIHPYFKTICEMQVSAHCLIKRTGDIIQFVSFEERAWHAGQSSFEGKSNCNDFSIGIELEGTDDIPYTADQYQALIQLTTILQGHYPLITTERITGHQDIAPGRKTDPGQSFDWPRYKRALR